MAQGRSDLPKLVKSRDAVNAKIVDRINIGDALAAKDVTSSDELDDLKYEVRSWNRFNADLLRSLFSTGSEEERYLKIRPEPTNNRWGLDEWSAYERRAIAKRIEFLRSVNERLELFEEETSIIPSPSAASVLKQTVRTRNVFIVHGRTDTRHEVARFLEKLDLHPIILEEQPSQGRTIIEKFEDCSNADFAVVLLTPDDVGGPSDVDSSNLQPRARQNVIFELGYFAAKISRGRVCALRKGDVEIPSDYSGVVYIDMDSTGGWKTKLGTEIDAAGINIDFNKLKLR